MHKVIATKDGGIQVELTEEEEKAVLAQWEAYEAKRPIKDQLKELKKQIPSDAEMTELLTKHHICKDESEKEVISRKISECCSIKEQVKQLTNTMNS